MLEPMSVLQDDAGDFSFTTLLDRCSSRPNELENMSMAEFRSKLYHCWKKLTDDVNDYIPDADE